MNAFPFNWAGPVVVVAIIPDFFSQERNFKVVKTYSAADVKATLVHLVAKIQKL